MQWARGAEWEQGSILAVDHKIKEYFPLELTKNFDHAIVVSHSCDIARDPEHEPGVEIIFCVLIEKSNGNYQYGKNPRTLHLTIQCNGDDKAIELQASNKIPISKEVLCRYMPETCFEMLLSGKKVLQSWLASRYRRHAFPDEFNRRMTKIVEFIKHEGRRHNEAVQGYWVDYDPDCELPLDQPYELDIYVVYSTDNVRFQKEAEDLVLKIREKFHKANIGIVLGKCEAYSEMEFTYFDIRMNYEYQLEYISLKEENS